MTSKHSQQFIRATKHDKRVKYGDDFAGDAWIDRYTGLVRYTAVGQSPNSGDQLLTTEQLDFDSAWRNTP